VRAPEDAKRAIDEAHAACITALERAAPMTEDEKRILCACRAYNLDSDEKIYRLVHSRGTGSDEDAFLAAQMRLVISHLRTAAKNIPDRSEYWADLVGQICQIKKGAN
jgi:hypothetical protein